MVESRASIRWRRELQDVGIDRQISSSHIVGDNEIEKPREEQGMEVHGE
jgi:hypothetical protein